MEKLLYKTAILLLSIFLNTICLSCDQYLEKPPGVDVTEDTIFSSPVQVDYFVAGTYYMGVKSDFPYWNEQDMSDIGSGAATDEAEITQGWYWCQAPWNAGGMNPSNTGDLRFTTHWKAIRRANTILERIDDAPFQDDAFKRRVKGEGYCIRALNYFELFRKYGGVPILRERVALGGDLKIPRNTVQEVVQFILDDCEEAIKLLPKPNELTTSQRGRLTNLAAMCLKARTLLYAASPTFNTDKPYINYGANNDLIILGTYDRERWKKAADAAKEVLDEADRTGVTLVKGKKDESGKDISYLYVWDHPDNEEVILADQCRGRVGTGHFPWNGHIPSVVGGSGGGLCMTFNFVMKYEKKNGTRQTWNMNGGDDLMEKYEELDPRFRQTATYHGQPWNSTDNLSMDLSQTGNDKCITGQYMHKPVPLSLSRRDNVLVEPKGCIFRLAEFYLSYAEALNEYYDVPPTEAYDAVDEVRKRAGMPVLSRDLTQGEFRDKVRNERAVELCMEGHRLYDVRRWEICEQEGVMKGNMYGIKIYKIEGTKECRYEPYVFEVRTFNRKMYRHPFSTGEMDKGYLIQNPGY
ncbi:RagB/SusD family nutrient uptake outer membrane protein [Bacteroides nordii]|uniref:RagB/SusD family nutrient uptake outer membrane protein n=1 Tax=Bacteroides nordii TaxID=291645 RepID=UPI00399BCF00